jgi:hypothetical protein
MLFTTPAPAHSFASLLLALAKKGQHPEIEQGPHLVSKYGKLAACSQAISFLPLGASPVVCGRGGDGLLVWEGGEAFGGGGGDGFTSVCACLVPL